MIDVSATRVARRFIRLSTALKMLLILGLALLPLGLVAVMASLDAARDGRAEREVVARGKAWQNAAAIESQISRDLLALEIAVRTVVANSSGSSSCRLLKPSGQGGGDLILARFAIFGPNGDRLCGSGAVERSALVDTSSRNDDISLDSLRQVLRFAASDGAVQGIGELNLAQLRSIASASAADLRIDIGLEQGVRSLSLIDQYDPSPVQSTITSRTRLAGSDVYAVASVGAMPISAVEIATILLPLLMWIAAATLGWLIVDRLLLRPIVKMQQAVLAYRPGGPPIDMPASVTPATEIHDLSDAFARVTRTIAIHETELEAAIARQARLVREVHHRVKNNLQVVASLLNLHARGAKSTDAANAYATIQRRVDALSVVHRNHFAELEDDRGVSLRSLLSELTGNLRATAPDEAAGMAITLDLDSAYVNQDVAVSVAFFVTEVVEHAMLCTPDQPVGVTLRQSASPTVARMILSSASLRVGANCTNVDVRQFERITTGLSRQLRAILERDGENGVFGIDIATLEMTASA